jgi:hypothetical protein
VHDADEDVRAMALEELPGLCNHKFVV